VEKAYGDAVRVVWKNFPLAMHRDAMGAHLAALAAGRQGKFWEFHDRVFASQHDLEPEAYERYARGLGLDVARFERDLADPALRKTIEADTAQGRSLGVTGTPAFFVNGRFLSGAQPFEEFARVINGELSRLGQPIPPGASGS
jgi:protein-disulfide isomerase